MNDPFPPAPAATREPPVARIDCHAHIGVDHLFYLQGWSPYCLDIPRLLLEAEHGAIDAFVVFPFITYVGLDQEALRANRIELRSSSRRRTCAAGSGRC
jgi:hypothetical protein